ncbi:MAG TPA: hypothetical protein DCS21_03950 [Gammaproteobacteria bacterium]|nr:hypothetical protein [Gammaproteobacteria bacterium]
MARDFTGRLLKQTLSKHSAIEGQKPFFLEVVIAIHAGNITATSRLKTAVSRRFSHSLESAHYGVAGGLQAEFRSF